MDSCQQSRHRSQSPFPSFYFMVIPREQIEFQVPDEYKTEEPKICDKCNGYSTTGSPEWVLFYNNGPKCSCLSQGVS